MSKGIKSDPNSDISHVYLLSLDIGNVRSFGPKQSLDLSNGNGSPARWTVILGDNGTGKTTILQSIAAFDPVDNGSKGNGEIYPQIFIDAKKRFSSWEPKDLGEMRGDFELSLTFAWGQSMESVSKESPSHTINIGVSGIKDKYRSFCSHTKSEIYGNINIYGYGASRRMSESSLTESDTGAVDGLFSDEYALTNAEEWLLQADYATKRSRSAAAKSRKEDIVNLLMDLLPDVSEIRFAEPKPPRLVPRVEFGTPYGWASIGDLSLGYRTMIAWMVDLAKRMYDKYPNSKNPLEEPAVVLIDEIDLHLHPKWQRDLIDFLSSKFKSTQFIATAHSPLVVQAAEGANIVVLKRAGDHVIIDNDPPSVQGWRLDQILSSELFDGISSRSEEAEKTLSERRALLAKTKLTADDKKRLKELNSIVDEMPTAETVADIRAMDIVRRAASLLNQAGFKDDKD